jgi:hypothetical protein
MKRKIVFSFMLVAIMIAQTGTSIVSALGSVAPDGADDTFGGGINFVVSDTTNVDIPRSVVKIYYPDNAARTITIRHADLCSTGVVQYDAELSRAPASGDDTYFGLFRAAVSASPKTEVQSGAAIDRATGVIDKNGGTCANRTLSLPANSLVRSPYNNRYVAYVVATKVMHGGVNSFSISAPGGVVGYDGSNDAATFGVDAVGNSANTINDPDPDSDGYGRINLPFAPDCTLVTGTAWVRMRWYDPDNNVAGIQPSTMYFKVFDVTTGTYLPDGSFRNGNRITNAGSNEWVPNSASNQYGSVEMLATADHQYRWEWYHVYDNNTIQFQLPYDSIYYLTGCTEANDTATLTPTAGADQTINVGQTATFTSSISSSNVNAGNTGSFTWRVTTSGSASYGARASTTTAIAGANPRTGTLGNFTTPVINVPGQYCRTIEILTAPAYASIPVRTDTQCINVVQPGSYRVDAIDTTYEKGGVVNGIVYNIYATPPCGPGSADITVDWNATGLGNSTVVNTADNVSPYNCAERLLTTATYTPPAATLIAQNVGSYGPFTVAITSPVNTSDSAFVNIYEAPFTRFFGSDVSICGTASTNRFTFDTANGAANYSRGSFVEYMSMYQSGNVVPNMTLIGLNSALNNGFPSGLDTNYTANTPGTCTGGVDTASDFVGATVTNLANNSTLSGDQAGKRTYYVNGNVTITGNITTSGNKSTAPFDPELYPVTLIYATGDINIASTVTNIEAVLVAGGSINTCTANTGAAIAKSNYQLPSPNGCRNALKITGAIAAPTVNLQRAIGTRLLADAASTTTVNGGNGTAAEIIEYPWYLSFVNFELADTSASKFNAYFSLPPRL